MDDNIEEWYITPEGEAFDLSVYETYTDLFSIKLHYAGRFTDSPNKQYVDGQGGDGQVDAIQRLVTLTEDDLEFLDYDLFESDQEDVPENARSRGLRKLKKSS
uniref:Uncharacterized protein n=1 Tax=Tanacetum cinerariifolium TaxID=118510 RepID=A0A699JHI8_TANCI|nr:hypothetical protein [Tanacetum cinerariifolium]